MDRPASAFLDTSGLFALINEDDAFHEPAHAVMKALHLERARIVTSDWVIAELLALASGPRLRRISAPMARELLQNPRVHVVAATRAGFLKALALYERRLDKAWSLVDCHSVLTCTEKGITHVFTEDHHFAQAGLSVLLR